MFCIDLSVRHLSGHRKDDPFTLLVNSERFKYVLLILLLGTFIEGFHFHFWCPIANFSWFERLTFSCDSCFFVESWGLPFTLAVALVIFVLDVFFLTGMGVLPILTVSIALMVEAPVRSIFLHLLAEVHSLAHVTVSVVDADPGSSWHGAFNA